MRAGNTWRRASALRLFVFATVVAVAGSDVSAHRLDELLQAARLSVEPDRVTLELDLTPGIALADDVVRDIDSNRDGELSEDEQQAYGRGVLGAIELGLDGRPLQLDEVIAIVPNLDVLRRGEGSIQVQSTVALPRSSDGAHQLTFRNGYRSDVSVYLANALAPTSDRIVVTGQRRDVQQRDLTI